MVELSLAHRVRMDRRASVLGEEGTSSGRNGTLFAVRSGIALLSFVYFIIGIVLATTMNYTWDGAEGSRPAEWYEKGSVTGHRVYATHLY